MGSELDSGAAAQAQSREMQASQPVRDGRPVRLNGPPRDVDAADVIALTDLASARAEVGKSSARYVHLIVDGRDTWLWLGDPPDHAAVTRLTAGLFGTDGGPRVGIDLRTVFAAYGDAICVRGSATQTALEADTQAARAVLKVSNDRSNQIGPDDALGAKMDQLWSVMNAGSGALNADEVPQAQQVGPKAKEGSWYNAIRLEDGQPNVHRSGHDTRTAPLPKLTMAEYRTMLIRDFDHEGAISAFTAAGGVDVFVAAVIRRTPQRAVELETVAREVWAYATTGMDTQQQTDIAQLQGYLYALDPRIQVSSDSNTVPGDAFNAGSSDAPLMVLGGDGAHGRATILTTRHIISNVGFADLEPRRIPLGGPGPQFDDRDRFVTDNSASMTHKKQPGVFDRVDEELGRGAYDPSGQRASMTTQIDANFGGADEHKMRALNTPAHPNLTRRAANSPHGQLADYSKVLEDAYDALYPEHTAQGAKAFAKLFGLERSFASIFTRSRVDGTPRYALNGQALRVTLGDVQPGRDSKDAHGESSLKAILMTLMYHPEYAETTLAGLSPEARPRLNAVADESEQGLEYLKLTQALAQHMNIEVRILAVPTSDRDFDAQSDIAIVDLQSMRIVEGKGDAGSEMGHLEFVSVVNGVKQTRRVPITSHIEDALPDRGGQPDQWQEASAPLIVNQRVAGRHE